MGVIIIKATKCHRGKETLMKVGSCKECPDFEKCDVPTIAEFFGRETKEKTEDRNGDD